MAPYSRPYLFGHAENSPSTSDATATPLPTLFGLPDPVVPYFDYGDTFAQSFTLGNIDGLTEDLQTVVHQGVSRQPSPVRPMRVQENTNEARGAPSSRDPASTLLDASSLLTPSEDFQETLSLGASQPDNTTAAKDVASRTGSQTDVPKLPQEENDEDGVETNGSTIAVYGKQYTNFLGIRRTPTIDQSLMARILVGQLENFPRMLIGGSRLPPFIYPQCVLDGRLPGQCVSPNGVHQCLPEPLANCVVLTQMFYNRTLSNNQLVWKTIYEEQKRLYEQVSKYSLLSPLLIACKTYREGQKPKLSYISTDPHFG